MKPQKIECPHCDHKECIQLGCAENRFYKGLDELVTCWIEMRAVNKAAQFEEVAYRKWIDANPA